VAEDMVFSTRTDLLVPLTRKSCEKTILQACFRVSWEDSVFVIIASMAITSGVARYQESQLSSFRREHVARPHCGEDF